MRIVSVVGTRPQLIKAAVLQPVLLRAHEAMLVDTGQHWDDSMAGAFVRELGLRRPDHVLAGGGGSSTAQTAAMLLGLEPILTAQRPDVVLVYGDTNSTLAGALAAARLDIPVAHVEAGLRSFDRRMPEELNRILADHLATWLFVPTPTAATNLAAEGIRDGVVEVGDLMQDLVAATLETVRDRSALHGLPGTRGRYLFVTIHRAENRTPEAIAQWAALLAAVADPRRPVVVALHPGTRRALEASGVRLDPGLVLVEPQGYRTSLALQLHADAVLTDSGGVQREAAWLGVPCLVLRERTEWPEALAAAGGTMLTIGLDASRCVAALEALAPLGRPSAAASRAGHNVVPPVDAAERILAALEGQWPPVR